MGFKGREYLEACKGGAKLPRDVVKVKATGDEIPIRGFDGPERRQFEDMLGEWKTRRKSGKVEGPPSPADDLMEWVFVHAVTNDDGSPAYAEADIPAVKSCQVPACVLDAVFDRALELSALKAAVAEDIRKNSGTAPGSGSASA